MQQTHRVSFSSVVWDAFSAGQPSGFEVQYSNSTIVHAFSLTAILCPIQHAYVSWRLLVGVSQGKDASTNRLSFWEKKIQGYKVCFTYKGKAST